MGPRTGKCPPANDGGNSDRDDEADTEFIDDVIGAAGVAGERGEDGLDKKIVAAVEDGGRPEAFGTES
jgi:hypothetical protein